MCLFLVSSTFHLSSAFLTQPQPVAQVGVRALEAGGEAHSPIAARRSMQTDEEDRDNDEQEEEVVKFKRPRSMVEVCLCG